MNDARITKVETRLDGHEDLCAERYRNLEHAIAGGKIATDRIYKMLWGVVTSLILLLISAAATLATQLWNMRNVTDSLSR